MEDILNGILNFISAKKFYLPIIVLFCGYVLHKLLKFISAKIIADTKKDLEAKKRKTIIVLIENISFYIIIVVIILIILGIFGVDTMALVAGLGIVGLVIGLALQDTIRDFISGFTIIMDNYFVVGDTIEFRGFKGEVISLGLRTTKIKKFSGEVQIFANRAIDVVINHSQKNSQILFEIGAPSDIDDVKIEKLLLSLVPDIESVKNVDANETEYLGIKEITDSWIKYLFKIKCTKMTQYQVKREVVKLIKKAFDAKKIKVTIV